MYATAETTGKTRSKDRDQILQEKENDGELNIASGDSLIEDVRDDRGFSDGNPDLREEIRITVRGETMTDIQYVFPGYAMTPRVHKQESGHKRKYFSSPIDAQLTMSTPAFRPPSIRKRNRRGNPMIKQSNLFRRFVMTTITMSLWINKVCATRQCLVNWWHCLQ